MSDDHCKDCQTPSACGHYAECLRPIIQRPAGDTRCKDCPGPAFGLCCRPAGDATPAASDEVERLVSAFRAALVRGGFADAEEEALLSAIRSLRPPALPAVGEPTDSQDAKRYRWLRANINLAAWSDIVLDRAADEWDASIDAALLSREPSGEAER